MAEPIATSITSPTANTQGVECAIGRPLTAEEGWRVVTAAKEWEGTPYSLIGAASKRGVGGDCSGTTHKIYGEAGFPYPYKMTSSFKEFAESTHQFSPVTGAPQAGDVLLWSGHMAIYAPFPDGDPRQDTGLMKKGVKQKNDMYTAFNPRTGDSYAPYSSVVFRGDAYTVWRHNVFPAQCAPNGK